MANLSIQQTKKYHIIYKTTNLVNQKIYIGAHSTDDIDDGYMGSGYNLNEAIKKYGKNNFERTILHVLPDPVKMFEREKEIVNKEFLSRPDVYNIVEGGNGGINKGAKGLKHMHHSEKKIRIAVHPSAIKKMEKDGFILGRGTSSTTNTIWIHKSEQKKMINPNELILYLEKGWVKGLPKSPTKDKIWIFNENTNEYSLCSSVELSTKLNEGWIKKKWTPVKQGETLWINDGKINLRIKKDDFIEYENKGWNKGMIQNHNR